MSASIDRISKVRWTESWSKLQLCGLKTVTMIATMLDIVISPPSSSLPSWNIYTARLATLRKGKIDDKCASREQVHSDEQLECEALPWCG